MSRVQFEWARDARLGKAVHITNAHHESGRWICLGCNWELVAKQGQIKAWHFAHKTESKCSGGGRGGESNEHEAAKLIIKETLAKWEFVGQPCLVCDDPMIKPYSFGDEFYDDQKSTWTVKEEVSIGDYRVDVGVFRNGRLWGAIEIWHKHAVADDKWVFLLDTLEKVYEVKASEVLANYKNEEPVAQDQHPGYVCERCEHKIEEQRRQALLREEHDKMLREEYRNRQEAERAEEDRRRRAWAARRAEEMEIEKAKVEMAAAEKLRIEKEKAAERLRMIQKESARRAQAEREEARMRAALLADAAREDMKHAGYHGPTKHTKGSRVKVSQPVSTATLAIQRKSTVTQGVQGSKYVNRARSMPQQSVLMFARS